MTTLDGSATSGKADPNQPYDGPLIGSMVTQAPVYAGMEAFKDKRIGYIRHGGKAPVDPTPIKLRQLRGGLVPPARWRVRVRRSTSRSISTTRRFGWEPRPPNLDDVLPYQYAWNTTMGTPLYNSVPSRDDMLTYQPYLKGRGPEGGARDGVRSRS